MFFNAISSDCFACLLQWLFSIGLLLVEALFFAEFHEIIVDGYLSFWGAGLRDYRACSDVDGWAYSFILSLKQKIDDNDFDPGFQGVFKDMVFADDINGVRS